MPKTVQSAPQLFSTLANAEANDRNLIVRKDEDSGVFQVSTEGKWKGRFLNMVSLGAHGREQARQVKSAFMDLLIEEDYAPRAGEGSRVDDGLVSRFSRLTPNEISIRNPQFTDMILGAQEDVTLAQKKRYVLEKIGHQSWDYLENTALRQKDGTFDEERAVGLLYRLTAPHQTLQDEVNRLAAFEALQIMAPPERRGEFYLMPNMDGDGNLVNAFRLIGDGKDKVERYYDLTTTTISQPMAKQLYEPSIVQAARSDVLRKAYIAGDDIGRYRALQAYKASDNQAMQDFLVMNMDNPKYARDNFQGHVLMENPALFGARFSDEGKTFDDILEFSNLSPRKGELRSKRLLYELSQSQYKNLGEVFSFGYGASNNPMLLEVANTIRDNTQYLTRQDVPVGQEQEDRILAEIGKMTLQAVPLSEIWEHADNMEEFLNPR